MRIIYKRNRRWSETMFELVLRFLTDTDSYQVSLVQVLVINNCERMFQIQAALVVNSPT